jgi:hypothetical protein
MSTKGTYKVVQNKTQAGLLECQLTHEVEQTNLKLDYFGPKMSPEVWNQILAFFKWTYDETKSESQVRLFVNPKEKRWSAWAFPQKANTGMTAQEIENSEAVEQRKQFSVADGWIYFGTVHHHCSASAFQSGTDESNEKNQDGIHITVGNLNSNQYSIDWRFYLNPYRVNSFNLCDFWDITEAYESIPTALRSLLKADAKEEIAKRLMGVPAPEGTEFPQLWKDNLIVQKAVVVASSYFPEGESSFGTRYAQNSWALSRLGISERAKKTLEFDKKKAMNELNEMIQNQMIDVESYEEIIDVCDRLTAFMDKNEMNIADCAFRNDMSTEALAQVVRDYIESVQKKHAHQQAAAAKQNGKQNGKQGKKTQQQAEQQAEAARMEQEYWWPYSGD